MTTLFTKPWQQPARALPVPLRPLGGETVISYTRRLSEANNLAPTTIMRTTGELTQNSGHHLLHLDAWLNDEAVARLEAIAGITRQRLTRALPALRHGAPYPRLSLPADRPALHCYKLWPPARPACRRCTLAVPASPGPLALVWPDSALICHRHRRWLDTTNGGTQHDLAASKDILTAHHRYQRLQASHTDAAWVTANFRAAWRITQWWAHSPGYLPALRTRWRNRAQALTLPPADITRPVVTFPEAVTLTCVLTDLDWRRHVALVPDYQLDRFYKRIAHRLAEPAYRSYRNDPVRDWVTSHRGKFAEARTSFWAQRNNLLAHIPEVPFPEKSQFK